MANISIKNGEWISISNIAKQIKGYVICIDDYVQEYDIGGLNNIIVYDTIDEVIKELKKIKSDDDDMDLHISPSYDEYKRDNIVFTFFEPRIRDKIVYLFNIKDDEYEKIMSKITMSKITMKSSNHKKKLQSKKIK